jgi:hypothetical protein
LSVERFRKKWSWGNSDFSNHHGWVPRNDRVGGDAFRNDGSSRDDRVLTDCYAFENDRVHADPDIVRDADRGGANGGTGRALLVAGCESERVLAAQRWIDWMKIRIGDPDVPGNQAVASNLNQLLGHQKSTVHQSKVADAAAAILTQRERATGVAGNIVAKLDGVVVSATEEAKNLRRFAVKSGAEVNC